MRVLIALGGNALTAPDGAARAGRPAGRVAVAAEHIAAVVADGHEVVLTHGNGPQVGNLLLMNELAAAVVAPMPLDWCDAQTQATIGSLLSTPWSARSRRAGSPLHGRRGHQPHARRPDDPGLTNPPSRSADTCRPTRPQS